MDLGIKSELGCLYVKVSVLLYKSKITVPTNWFTCAHWQNMKIQIYCLHWVCLRVSVYTFIPKIAILQYFYAKMPSNLLMCMCFLILKLLIMNPLYIRNLLRSLSFIKFPEYTLLNIWHLIHFEIYQAQISLASTFFHLSPKIIYIQVLKYDGLFPSVMVCLSVSPPFHVQISFPYLVAFSPPPSLYTPR